MTEKKDYFGLFIYYGLLCETIKYQLYKNMIDLLNENEDTYDNRAVVTTFQYYLDESFEFIQYLYDKLKQNYYENNIYDLGHNYILEFNESNNCSIQI